MNFYKNFLEKKGEKKYRIDQVDNAIYKQLAGSWDEIMTLPLALREELKGEFPDFMPLKVIKEQVSAIDGTTKVLFETLDGKKLEAVLMRHDNDRNTVCVSCQIGCPQNCLFCATGKLGLVRNLNADEIVAQVLYFARKLKLQKSSFRDFSGGHDTNEEFNKKFNSNYQRVTNVVYMGMGEPFLNYDNVMESVKFLQDQKRLGLGARHITISTSGVIPGIKRFTEEDSQINLAISIHAGTDETRSKIMPVNMAYPLKDLIQSLTDYQKVSNRKLFYEYLMLEGINDDPHEAESLALLIGPQISHVNIIPFNSIRDKGQGNKSYKVIKLSSYQVKNGKLGVIASEGNVRHCEEPELVEGDEAIQCLELSKTNDEQMLDEVNNNAKNLICSSRTRMREFQDIFKRYGVPSTIRVSLGQDIDGACGQLAGD